MRFKFRELTYARISGALQRRAADLPDRLSWCFSNDARENRERLERYRDRHRGERCVVLGNGPSLKRTDLSLLRDTITFGVNRVYLLAEQSPFVPTYYTCVNELVLEQYSADIARLRMPRFLAWGSRGRLPDDETIMYLRLRYALNDVFGTDLRRPICSGGTVTFVALQLAYFMGFAEVVLIGVDHHFVDRGTPNRTELRTAERDENHFHPDYFPKGSRWQLPDLVRSELAYAQARAAYSRAGRRIIDATVGGQCPTFEKADYAQLFS